MYKTQNKWEGVKKKKAKGKNELKNNSATDFVNKK